MYHQIGTSSSCAGEFSTAFRTIVALVLSVSFGLRVLRGIGSCASYPWSGTPADRKTLAHASISRSCWSFLPVTQRAKKLLTILVVTNSTSDRSRLLSFLLQQISVSASLDDAGLLAFGRERLNGVDKTSNGVLDRELELLGSTKELIITVALNSLNFVTVHSDTHICTHTLTSAHYYIGE